MFDIFILSIPWKKFKKQNNAEKFQRASNQEVISLKIFLRVVIKNDSPQQPILFLTVTTKNE